MNLEEAIRFAFQAHQDHPTKLAKAVRKWDGRTPYAIHPTWCAMTLLTETLLPEELRRHGAQALLFHDILEDTTCALPPETPVPVRALVAEMTFASFEEEMVEVWSRSQECLLLKLYDKVSNLLDGAWMGQEKRAQYIAYTRRIAAEVERTYGSRLNILAITRAVCTQ